MMRAILVDDEPLAMEKLRRLLRESNRVEVVGTFVHPSDALAALSTTKADVFFLDIEMPGTDGLTLADQILGIDPSVQIVFVTAYNDYAVEAFELNALDYLLKPVRRERLHNTLERIVSSKRIEEEINNLRVRCLGGFKVLLDSDGAASLKWRTSKAQELLAFLVHCRGQAVSRQTIVDTLWDHLDGDRATAHFHTTLYYLRKNLSTAGFSDLIQHENGVYWLDPHRIDCDYYEFDKLTFRELEGSQLTKASNQFLSLYQGAYLDGLSWSWAEPIRQDLEEKYISLSLQLYDKHLEALDVSLAIKVLKTALKFAPFNEEIHGKLMDAYLMMDDRVAAVRQYEVLKQRLKTEYGIEPSDAIKQLLNQKNR